MKKVKRNLVLFFSILTLVAVMFTACPHPETRNYKTLTLHIQGKEDQKLYYQNGWYSDVKGNDVDSEKPVNVGTFAFDVAKPNWTVEFGVEVPTEVADDKKSEFKVETGESPITVTAGDLSFDVKTIVDATTGKLLENASIDNDTTVSGTYAAGKISDDEGIQIKAAEGYKFKEWKVEGKTTTDLKTYEIKGNIKFTATFEKTETPKPPVEQPKKLTIGEKSYYYKDSKWYSDSNCENVITEVSAPEQTSKTLTATLNAGEQGAVFEDGYTASLTATSTFLGYGLESEEAVIKYESEKCTLPSGGIGSDTTYVEKWSKAHYEAPENPKDKENAWDFEKWLDKDGNEYKFAEVEAVNGIKLTASWSAKKVLTISEAEKYYYNSKEGDKKGWWSDPDYTAQVTSVKSVESKAVNVTIDTNEGTIAENQDRGHGYLDTNKVSLAFIEYVKKGDATVKIVDSTYALPNGGIGASVEVEPKYEEKPLKLPELTKTDNTFGGYKLNGKGDTLTAGTEITINADTAEGKYVAQWTEVPTYTLTLDGTVKAWYKASKWYSDSNCETDLGENKIADIPDAKSYDVTLDPNGGTLASGVTSPAKTTDGEFLGYFEKDGDGNPTGEAVIGTDGSVAGLTMAANKDLVSKFKAAAFANPGDPTADNRTFAKWVEVKDESETDFTFPLTVTDNITLKAIYDWNVATVTIGETTYYYKENAWYDDQNCEGANKVISIKNYPGTTKQITATLSGGDQTFSTTVGPLEVSIVFNGYKTEGVETPILKESGSLADLNGYTYNGKSFTETWEGSQFTEPNPAPTCVAENKVFKEWQKDGEKYGFNVAETTNITLTAIWEDKVANVVIGGTTYYYKGDKWYDNSNCTGEGLSVVNDLPASPATVDDITATLSAGEGFGFKEGTNTTIKAQKTFKGYADSEGKIVIQSTGSLTGVDGYKIASSLTESWNDPKFVEPQGVESSDGKQVTGWKNGEDTYNFDSTAVNGITLVAQWSES